jgi:hypothetical protein
MRGATIVVLLAIGLLVFGCTGPQAQANTSGSAGANTGGNGAMANESGSAMGGEGQGMVNESGNAMGGEGQGMNGSGTATGGTTTGGSAGTGGNDYAGLDYAALLALGVPLQCDVTTTASGKTTQMKMYVNSQGVVRVEVPDDTSGLCDSNVMVMKDKKLYMGCMGSQVVQGCDWLEFAASANESAGAGAGSSGSGYSAPNLNDSSATDFNCQPWVLDASKFDTPGKVCNLQDMQGMMGNNYG